MTHRCSPVNAPLSIRAVVRRVGIVLVTWVLFQATSLAQSPWERAATNLETSFTGPLARSLALVAIVIGGLMFMFGEGGLCLFAVQFLAWLF